MPILISNTRTGSKTELKPLTDNHVKMYVCGITAYDYCHIGHARSALAFDMIYRYLLYRGYEVTYVRNFTDIDDKIINRAIEQGISTEELSERFIRKFHEDMEQLGIASPTVEPKATEHVREIIDMIRDLVEKGMAYQVDGDVYYAVEKFSDYGVLSRRSIEDMQAGARIEVNEKKRNPMDFALWKSSKPGEPTWDSPWGLGRPGWHIECSAMSKKYLGDSFDIHGGGKDLIFPHHENEIAQSMGATGSPFVNIWVHHGFVTIRDEKMSKSLGNFLTIRDVLGKFRPEALRLFVFSTHYQSPLNYSETAIYDAEIGLERLYECLAEIARLPESGIEGKGSVISKKDAAKLASLEERFQKAMDNDFNTAQALARLFDAVKILNKISRALPGEPARNDIDLLRNTGAKLQELANIMGLLIEDPVEHAEALQEKRMQELGLDPTEIEAMIQERSEARENKDWARSDAIRDELLARGVELKDGVEGTTWKVKG
ncbi:cysteine--tRNA ligase [Thermodesulfobacteriota bacterium]